jgi:uncharacterized protein YggE
MRRRSVIVIVIAVVLLAGSAIAGVAQPRLGRSTGAPSRTITASGQATVTIVPDRASFDFGVENRAPTAAAALARTGAAAAAVVQAIKAAGVPAGEVQTSQVSLMPQTTADGSTIIAYTASETISATTTIAKAGALVNAAVSAGADGVSGPSLSHSDSDVFYREALKKAVADAENKAAALASSAGIGLGAVQTIVEGSAPTPLPYASAKADASLPIEPGTQTVDASVTVTYSAG